MEVFFMKIIRFSRSIVLQSLFHICTMYCCCKHNTILFFMRVKQKYDDVFVTNLQTYSSEGHKSMPCTSVTDVNT